RSSMNASRAWAAGAPAISYFIAEAVGSFTRYEPEAHAASETSSALAILHRANLNPNEEQGDIHGPPYCDSDCEPSLASELIAWLVRPDPRPRDELVWFL